MSDMRVALVMTADASGLKLGVRDATGAVKDFGDQAQTSMRKVQAAANSVAEVDKRLGVGSRQNAQARAADIAAYGRELDQLRAKYNPLFALQQTYRTQLAEVNSALKVGALNQREFANAMAATKAGFAQQVQQLRGMGSAASGFFGNFNKYGTQIQGLGYQVGDLAVQLASGQRFMVAFAQQGGQALQLFGGPWGAVLGAALSIVSALTIGLGGMGDSTADLAKATAEWEDAQRSANEILLTSAELSQLRRQQLIDETKAKHESRAAEIADTVAKLQNVAAMERQIETSGRIGGLVGSNVYGNKGGSGAAEQEIEEQYIQLGLLQETLDRLNDPSKWGSVRDQLAQLGKEAADSAKRVADAQKDLQSLGTTIADLAAQRQALDNGGVEGLRITQDAQKARDMLLSFGEAAELGTTNMAALEHAAGMTAEQIAAWLAEQRTLNDAIAENLELLEKQANAPETFDKYITGLEQQNEELQLEVSGRKQLIPLLRAERDLKEQMGKDLSPEQRQQLQGLLEDQTKLNAAIDRQKEITDAAKKSAEMMQEPYKNALRGIQQAWTDMFRKLLDGNIKSFKDFGRSLLGIFKQLAAEIATLLVFRPVVGGLLSNLGMGGMATQLGMGGTAGGATGMGSGGMNMSSLFSANLSGGQWNSGWGSMIFGTQSVATNGAGMRATGVAGMGAVGGGTGLNSSFSGQAGSFLNSPIGGGMLSGLLAAGATAASGGTTGETVGAGVGGAIGGIAGSYFGPVGSMIGSTVGSMLGKFVGSMFNKKPKYKKVKSVAGADLGFDSYGMLGVDGSFAYAKGKGAKEDNQAGGKLGSAMADAFNDFFLDLGATFDDEASARVQEVYQARVKGKKKKGEKHYFYGSFADEYIGTAETAEQFLPMFLSGSLAVAAQKGLVQGVSDTILTIFKNVVADNGGVGVSDQDEITRMVEFGKFYDRVDQIRTPAQAAAEALKDLNKAMASAKATAEEFGLSVDHIDDVFKENFIDELNADILAIKDPQAAAMAELEKEYEARKAVATELGVDLAKVEELYALKRKEVVEAGLNQTQDQFRAFFDELKLGDLAAGTPTQKLDQARGRYDDVVNSGDTGSVVEAARNYLEVAKGYFGMTQSYAQIYEQIIAKVRELGNIHGFAGGGLATGLSVVGEQGPELINAGSGSMVINARQAAQYLGRFHRFGDTELVHVNDNEISMLDAAGGANTRNPWTGLREFWSEKGVDSKSGGGVGGSGGANGNGKGGAAGDSKGGGKGSDGWGGGAGKTQPRDPAGPAGGISGGSEAGPGAKGYSGNSEKGTGFGGWLDELLGYENLGQRRKAYGNNPNNPANQTPVAYVPNYPFATPGYIAGQMLDLAVSMMPGMGLGMAAYKASGIMSGDFDGPFTDMAESLGASRGQQVGEKGVGVERDGRGGALGGTLMAMTTMAAAASGATPQQLVDINARMAQLMGGGSGTGSVTDPNAETIKLLTEIRDGVTEGQDTLAATFTDKFEKLTAETRRQRLDSVHATNNQQWSGKVLAVGNGRR